MTIYEFILSISVVLIATGFVCFLLFIYGEPICTLSSIKNNRNNSMKPLKGEIHNEKKK